MTKTQETKLSPTAVRPLKIVFFTLFLDLIGFAIIFPLFPAMAEYYLKVDSDNIFLRFIFDSIRYLTNVGGSDVSGIVLFGAALGGLYSLLQFVAAPFWGSLSDRIGRRPVLLVSVFFLGLSYLLWVFAGSFTMLILARFVGGIMGGNISAATAVVADVTTKETRSRGMATIGIAFALGFIFGPVIGGVSSLYNPLISNPEWQAYGINPFSAPALVAFILAFINWLFIWRSFKETLPPEKRGNYKGERSSNIFKIFKPLPYAGVNLTNMGYFLFLMAFSGMEFTLTFLAVEKFSYSPMDNAYMFIFIGLIIAGVQGGFVRRRAGAIGEKRVAIMGLITIIPGLILIGLAQGSLVLYAGLFFLSAGSAMCIPCLTSLVSLYTPAQEQGKAVGIFRSLGALARVIGPVVAAILYWRLGSSWPYFIGAAFLIIPILMIGKLPKVSQ